ncbi:MAG: T9SS type A sorting domain-containing protein [Bacteroidetes bacterium]|nr:T9SS type A sorting domain-containing protein [Bacteroidota bacterium]
MMSKKLIILFFFALVISLNGQNQKQGASSFEEFQADKQNSSNEIFSSAALTDTLKPASFSMSCYTTNPSSALVLYYADVKVPHDSGYVSGTNIYGDLEKAQHYLVNSTTTITGCAVLLKRAYSGTSSSIGTKVKIYGYASGAPTTSVIASTSLMPQYQLNNSGFTVFTFSVPVVLTGNFVMSVVLPNNAGDTTAIFSTKTTCNSSTSESWEKAVNNVWGSIHSNWNFSISQNIDLAIFPLIKGTVTTEIKEEQSNPNSVLFDGENCILKTALLSYPLSVIVKDLSGKTCVKRTMDSHEEFDMKILPNGVYILQSGEANGNPLKKIVVFH